MLPFYMNHSTDRLMLVDERRHNVHIRSALQAALPCEDEDVVGFEIFKVSIS